MKTKSLILIAFAAIITLSFSFAASSNRSSKINAKEPVAASQQVIEPIEGFVSEDKF